MHDSLKKSDRNAIWTINLLIGVITRIQIEETDSSFVKMFSRFLNLANDPV